MKYLFCVVVFFCLYINTSYGQQNLVLNPSFEDVNEEELRCGFYTSPTDFNNAIQNWTLPSLGTSDIYHMSLDESCLSSPLNPLMASLLPRTGDSMVGIIVDENMYDSNGENNSIVNKYREYIQGQLSSPLLVGNKYKVKFYTYLSNYSSYGVNNIGIKFFADSYFQDNDSLIDQIPDANHMEVIMAKDEWYLIDFEFIPQTVGLNYFVIGNFSNNENTLIEIVEGTITNPLPIFPTSYYFIDDVSVVDISPPIFDQMESFCQGATFALPEQSENGYSGSWSPAVNNQETTTYIFTPDNPDVEPVTLTVEIIEPYIEPIFDVETSVCNGTTFTLPSVSENGITGTWSPEINNQKTTTYTFTPEVGSCALETSITIEVVDILTPEFTLPSFICEGTALVLPEVSNNGIAGTWTPTIDNQQTTTYTFTPVGYDCAVPVTVPVEVKRIDTPLLNSYCAKNELYVEVVNPDLTNQFQWQINGIAIEELSPTIQLSKYANLLHDNQNKVTVSITNISGCMATNILEIDNKNLCFIPRGISPQGDGVNDRFDLSHFGGVSLQIFNRYGKKVYDKKNYQNEWFGQTNSSTTLLPGGTYFYQFVTNQGETLSGWVQLMY